MLDKAHTVSMVEDDIATLINKKYRIMKEKKDLKKLAEEVKEDNAELNCDAPWSDIDTKIHGPRSCGE